MYYSLLKKKKKYKTRMGTSNTQAQNLVPE